MFPVCVLSSCSSGTNRERTGRRDTFKIIEDLLIQIWVIRACKLSANGAKIEESIVYGSIEILQVTSQASKRVSQMLNNNNILHYK